VTFFRVLRAQSADNVEIKIQALMVTSDTAFNITHYENIYPVGIEHQYWQIARNKSLFNALLAFEEFKERKILEVGCGRGDVVAFMRARGFDYWGCELSAEVPVLDLVNNFVVKGKDANELPKEFRDQVGVITLFDVIEHLPDPALFLKSIKKSFINVKHLVITVPACQEIWSNYDEFNGHYRRYDLSMMSQLSDEIGSVLKTNRYFFKLLYFPALVLKLIGKDRSTKLKAPVSRIEKRIHKMLAHIFVFVDQLLPAPVKGSSVLSIISIR